MSSRHDASEGGLTSNSSSTLNGRKRGSSPTMTDLLLKRLRTAYEESLVAYDPVPLSQPAVFVSCNDLPSLEAAEDQEWIDILFHYAADDSPASTCESPHKKSNNERESHTEIRASTVHDEIDSTSMPRICTPVSPEPTNSSFRNDIHSPLDLLPQDALPHLSIPTRSSYESDQLSDMSVPNCMKTTETPMLMTLTSFPFRVVQANQACADLFPGTRYGDFVGVPLFELIVAECRQKTLTIPYCPTLLQEFNGEIVRLNCKAVSPKDHRSGNKSSSDVVCKVHIRPLNGDDDVQGGADKQTETATGELRQWVISLHPLEV